MIQLKVRKKICENSKLINCAKLPNVRNGVGNAHDLPYRHSVLDTGFGFLS